MEDTIINREIISDLIFNQLIENEDLGIKTWKENFEKLKVNQHQSNSLISVLTCVYNSEGYIKNALESILLQSYQNFEIVIVADPYGDQTIEIIKEFAVENPQIKLIVNPERKGFIGSINIGLNYCEGDYIARMDLDDLIHPLRLEKQINFLKENTNCAIVSAWMKIFDEQKQITEVKYRLNYDEHKNTSLFFSPLSHAASMFKSEVLKTLRYREGYIYTEDYDLWTRVLMQYKTACLPEYLYLYRTHSEQVTNIKNIEPTKESLRKIIKNFNEIFGLDNSKIEFHLEYLMHDKPIDSKKIFLEWNDYLESFLTKNVFLNQQSFCQYVFKNYWQGYYKTFKNQLSLGEKFKLFRSKFNQMSHIQFLKSLI